MTDTAETPVTSAPGDHIVHRKPHSYIVTDGIERAAARGMLRAVGMGYDDWRKPQIGEASSWNPEPSGSGRAGDVPRLTLAVGTTSRRCWNDQRLTGAFCQLASDQRCSTAGGKPIMVMAGLLQQV